MHNVDRGIWAIWYDIPHEHTAAYLDWFHRVHIPEKLSRPGYLWASHYELVERAGAPQSGKAYLAFFGGENTHAFMNPSPRQLLTRQSAETKHFMGMRGDPGACILNEEIRIAGPAANNELTTAPAIQFGNYNASTPAVEDDLGAWYAQERLPLLAKLAGVVRARKMLATVGEYKHAILHEFESLAARERHFGPYEAQAHDPATWMGRVRQELKHAPRSPAVGRRIWPPLPA
jgi:hypothetical protein